MNNQPSTTQVLSGLISKDGVQAKFDEILGDNKATFISSLIQAVNQNDMLSKSDPKTILSAAMMAAAVKLPINSNLGFAYIVPFYNSKTKKTEAQFQIGYKGFIQLAMRTGEFKNISVTEVYNGQIIEENPLTGHIFDWSKTPKENSEPVGYVAYFRLLNGFEATHYMTLEQVKSHALKYSQSFKKNSGPWKENFNGMAMKTALKLLLSKFAPLSVEIQHAIENDQATRNGDKVIYGDNQAQEAPYQYLKGELINNDQIADIERLITDSKSNKAAALASCGAAEIAQLSIKQYHVLKAKLISKIPAEGQFKETPQSEEIEI